MRLFSTRSAAATLIGLQAIAGGCAIALTVVPGYDAVLLRFDFDLSIAQVDQMLIGLPWVVMIGCGAFLVAGVYRGIWRYTGLAEGVRFVLAAMIAGLTVKLASALLPITISRAALVVFVILLFNFLVATRWSFHVFQRIGRFLAHSARRLVIVGADARGAAAVQHLHSTIGAGAELLGLLDDDSFKHGKLFHGYPVLGSLDNLGAIMARTPFDEIVVAQETLSATQLAALESFTLSHRVTLRRFWLGVTDMSAPAISGRQLTTA